MTDERPDLDEFINEDDIRVAVKPLKNAVGLKLPSYATSQSAGMDLTAALEEALELGPGERALIPTGLSIALPKGYEAQIRPRSGLAINHGVTVLNTPGTIDADYRGEIKVILINHGQEPYTVQRGVRIAQMVVERFSHVDWQIVKDIDDNSERGEGGFGSTGTE